MPVKIGNSYVTEAALAYAQECADEKSENVLNDLQKQFKDIKFSVGTQPFGGSGTKNITISPNILRQIANDPEKRMEYGHCSTKGTRKITRNTARINKLCTAINTANTLSRSLFFFNSILEILLYRILYWLSHPISSILTMEGRSMIIEIAEPLLKFGKLPSIALYSFVDTRLMFPAKAAGIP